MEEDKAVKSVVDELISSEVLYGFKPDDIKERFFIGEAILAIAAGIFIAAFLKGVTSALEKKVEELGKEITNWLIDKLEDLFRKPKISKDEAKLKEDMHILSKSAAKLEKKILDLRLDIIEKLVTKTLIQHGITPKKAVKFAKKTRKAAVTFISEGSGHGTK